MASRMFALVLAAAVVGFAPYQTAASFDPVGTWRVATIDDSGQPMTVTVNIAGKPGAYTGRAVTPTRTVPLLDLATTPSSMIAIFSMPEGVVLLRIVAESSGRHSGAWAVVEQTYPVTAQRMK